VCECDEVDSGSEVHFHVKCDNCDLRFAMETAFAQDERKRRQQKEKEAKGAN
jgi:hypothetical protein